jgi:deoxyribodipyrimidine photo-lyase
MGLDGSTKFSPYLALGCLSPRYIYHEIKRYERVNGGQTDGSYWLVFELMWRDFFKLVAVKFGSRLFHRHGIHPYPPADRLQWRQDPVAFEKWTQGRTGIPWVDAAMRELLQTGFMSNRLRQNVASFLCHSLRLDWRLGAAWFESQLIDHDVHSNYGNWLYIAGLGNDPRENRKFNMIKQARDYDPQGRYVKLWVKELSGLPDGDERLIVPWKYPAPYLPPILVEREWERYSTPPQGKRQPRQSDWKVKKFAK